MVSRTRLKSILTGLALYTMAALMVGYFGVNAYTGKYGLNARQELDQEIIALTSELARLKRERAQGEQRVSLDHQAELIFKPLSRTRFGTTTEVRAPVRKFQKTAKSISKMSRRAAVRHSNILPSARNPFTLV
jgi:cell division protein FtsB